MSTNAPTAVQRICLDHLGKLKTSADHFQMAAVSSADGFPVAMLDLDPQEGRKATAMAAALDGLSKSIVKELQLGALEGTVLECELGLVLCRQVVTPRLKLVLLLVVGARASYGQALWAVKKAAREMAGSLSDAVPAA